MALRVRITPVLVAALRILKMSLANCSYQTADLLRVSLGIEDFVDIRKDFEQAFKIADLPKAQKAGIDPFQTAMNLVSGGFMGKLATGAPKPGTDGTIG